MNFTREPLILSVITPKEGSKLVIRKSSGADHEDYFVDSVEIVSFEGAIFFRSLERPKSFVLPASDYEVLEVKETKMVLKNVSLEKSIKIGGNKDNNNQDKKNKKIHPKKKKQQQNPPQKESIKKESVKDEINEEVSSSVLRKLFPPPNVLIKERLTRYKVDEDLPVVVEEEPGIQANIEISSVIVKDEEPSKKILEDSKKNVENNSEEDNNITQDK